MAEEGPSIYFEDVPLEEARRIGRGPRLEPRLYDSLRQKLQALSTGAVRLRLGPELTPAQMARYVRAIAHQLEIPVVTRRVPGGIVFWRASEDDRREAEALARRLQGEPPPPVVTPPRRGRPRNAVAKPPRRP